MPESGILTAKPFPMSYVPTMAQFALACTLVSTAILMACANTPSHRGQPQQTLKEPPASFARLEQATPVTNSPPTCADDCDTCVAEFRDWTRVLVDEGGERSFPIFEGAPVQLPATLQSVPLPSLPATHIYLDASATHVRIRENKDKAPQAKPVAIAKLTQRLNSQYDWACNATRRTPFSPEVVVHIDAKTRWRVIRRVVSQIAATSVDSVVFAFTKPTVLAQTNPAIPKRTFEQTFGECKPAHKGLHQDWPMTSTEEREWLEGLPDAIAACECKVNVDAAKAFLLRRRAERGPGSASPDDSYGHMVPVGLRLNLTGDEKPKPISLADHTTWADAYQSIVDTSPETAFYLTHPKDKSAPPRGRAAGEVCQEFRVAFAHGVMKRTRPNSWYQLRSGRGPIVKPPEVLGLSPVPHVGDVDRNMIRRYARRKLPQIGECYAKELLVTPELGGIVSTYIEILPDGQVQKATTVGLSNQNLESCVSKVIKTIQFAKSKKDVRTTSYGFIFNPGYWD